ncbi:MAG: CRTAC1 family protein [Gemmatimonadetes bacterium]|nr:CRTAC1 family protein [Gemmatimonadota bacterium]
MGPGCAFVDFDGDGFLDIYFVNGHPLEGDIAEEETNRLYRNKGNGTFTDVTRDSGIGDAGYGVGVTGGDIDNDGDVDIFVTNYGPNVLYRNEGDGRFIDITESAGVGDDRWGVGCSFLDYDSDGLLDLYVANYVDFSLDTPKENTVPYMPRGSREAGTRQVTGYPHPDNYQGSADLLYRNRGDGRFADVTHQAGVYNPEGKGMGMASGDYDNDGDVDIYVGNDLTPNFLYQNEGDGTFTDVALLAGVAYNEDGKMESSMGVDFGDYDGDGFLDLLVPNFQGEACTLYHNLGNGFFNNESVISGIGLPTRPFVGWGGGFLDYDHDGDLDIFIATGHVLDNVELFDSRTSYEQANFLFRNEGEDDRGKISFDDVSKEAGSGLAIEKASRGTAFGDYDNDGDVDVLVVNCNDTPTLLRNDGGNRSHWLQVKTEGEPSNRDGVGARIKVISGDWVQIREVKSGSSLYSQSDSRVDFGLGSKVTVERMEIRWPSGRIDTLVNLPADQSLTIREGTGLVEGD